MDYSNIKQLIGKTVEVQIDRPVDSKHPKYSFDYPVNYGFIKNIIAPDGEALDAYILGTDQPVEKIKGECIAIVHRVNDDDDKLVVAVNNKSFTDREILELVNFQEQYFKSDIIR